MSTTLPRYQDATALAEAIAQRCEQATLHGETWHACCPSHDDTHPSLSITAGTGKVLLKCHAGCTYKEIVAALGLKLSDLFVQSEPNGHHRLLEVYPYVDAHGTLVHETLRYAPKKFVQRRPDPANPGDYLWNLHGIEPVLYRLPQVLAAIERGETIYLVEGEKDVRTVEALGLTATTNPMGADTSAKAQSKRPKWRASYTASLRGADVVIVPDNDEDGHLHAIHVAQKLQGQARRVRMVPLPGLPPKGDITDWLQSGKTLDDLQHEVSKAVDGLSSLLSSQLVRMGDVPVSAHKTTVNGLSSLSSLSSQPEWPTLAPEAFYGIAGTIVNTIAPHSEADPVALLMQLLEYFGVILGRKAYYQVEATKHYTNLNSCLVGATAKGRKGTAYDHIEAIMQTIDTSWSLNNVSGGCGSGEGLIAAVRDKTMKREPIKVKGRVTGYEDIETDLGVIDKRLLVYEAEFSSVLKVAGREGNILSEILRKAWETGHLRNTVKNNPLKATGAHIAIIGHITIDELQRTLTTTDMGNGFANRFLWVCVKRSQFLPDGGDLESVDFQPLLDQLRAVFRKAKEVQRMRRDAAAKAAWHAVYRPLSEDRPGLVGSLLARAEAQVLRLSMLYALLDGTDTIRPEHLDAALALWEYVEASVVYIFGTSIGDPVADTLLIALAEAPEEGLSRKQILTETFQGHLRADELDRVLRLLQQRQLVQVEKLPAEGGRGRPKEIVKYCECELSELSELNQGGYLSISKDAVKAHQEDNDDLRTYCELKCELNHEADPDPCLHEHIHDTGYCNDCGLLLDEGRAR